MGAVLAPIALLAATGCSPDQVKAFVYGNGQAFHVDAKQGPDDGGGPWFRAGIVCSGEAFWRYGSWVNVEGKPNFSDNRYVSEAICPNGRLVVGTTIDR